MNQKGIVVAGNLIADVGYTIDLYPKRGNLTWMYDPIPHTGGANNLIVDLARIDPQLSVIVAGLIGEDENGEFIIDTLSAYQNIDTTHVIKGGRTAVSFAMTEKESKQRTFFFDPGTSLTFNEAQIDFNLLDADLFHLEYLLLLGTLDEPDAQYGTRAARVLAAAKQKGMETSIDMVSEESGRYQQVVWPALKYTDYFVANEIEGSGVTGIQMYDEQGVLEDAVWAGLEKVRVLGVGKWAVIHSPSCGYGLNCQTKERVKVSSFKLPKGFIKGTTGAGDAFCAGVIYAAYKKMDLEQGLRIGAICAACSLSREDSNSGVIKLEEMEKYIKVYR
jgi:sugar/nucleoside kinase (ribokinase family)